MKLREAKLCLNPDCEEIYIGDVCPKCTEPHAAFISDWIIPLQSNPNKKTVTNFIDQKRKELPV